MHCRHLRERGLLSHTSYWTDLGFHGDPNHVDALRMALDLDDRATASTLPSSTDEEGPAPEGRLIEGRWEPGRAGPA